jgi:lysophospholipase L1-like esterase
LTRRASPGALTPANLALAALTFLFGSVAIDRGLGLLGFPDEWTRRTSNPPNYRERRSNIEFAYDSQTNSQGLRERELPLPKPPGLARIFLAGDSFTEGVGVSDDQTFVARLERYLRDRGANVQTINGGLNGAGPRDYGRLFLEVGSRYQPDGLVLCIYANDVSDTPPDARSQDLDPTPPVRSGSRAALHRGWPHVYTLLLQLRYERLQRESTRPDDLVAAVSRRARQLGIPPDRIARWKARLPAELVAAANEGRFNGYVLSHGLLRPDWWTAALDLDTADAKQRFRAMCEVLSAVVARGRQRGVAAAAVFLPSRLQYDASLYVPGASNLWREVGVEVRPEWSREETELQRRLRSWAEREGIPFLDLTPRFREAIRKGQLTWSLDEHWTAEGHRVAACAIGAWLARGGVFPFIGTLPAGQDLDCPPRP